MSVTKKVAGSATEWAETIDGPPPPAVAKSAAPKARVSPEQQLEIERFLYDQAVILDEKRWADWLAVFAVDGPYWMPAPETDTTGDGVPSIFYEDVDLMRVRAKRVNHPRAWSQKPPHRTTHVVSNVIVESIDQATGDVVVRSKFHMAEFRRDDLRHFAGKYRHHLIRTRDGYRIKLQRVDLVNVDGIYEYVIQTWI